MSKVNAVRFINLNYNNNAIRISDETFQMGGRSTLLSLRNGGGKSVLVQMMTAPFVHKQYRKTKDRPFESYFTSSKPTFIMVEWKLDGGAGYVLTGMMVRKSQIMEEQSSEPLEIVNFISEYTTRCEEDIYHLPVVEKGKKEIVLKNYGFCRQLFEGYKKDRSKKFYYYDMNNYAQSRQYFDKLAEYQIYYKEWETIIRKVNLKESGLSELFSDCKNEKELIEKWFLDSIESKLNREKDRMKEFQSIVEKYIISYKDNKSKIERRDTILEFQTDMKELQQYGEAYEIAEKQIHAMENRIAAFRSVLVQIEKDTVARQSEQEQQRAGMEEQLAHIMYEKLSMEIYELMEQKKYHTGNRDMISMEMNELELETEYVEKLIHSYACAKQQKIVDEYTRDNELLVEKIAVYRENEKEYEPERKKLGGYLHTHYGDKFRKAGQNAEQIQREYDSNLGRQQEMIEKECEYQTRIEELIAEIAKDQERLSSFDRQEEVFNRDYQEHFVRNIIGTYEPGMLQIKKEQYVQEQEQLHRNNMQHKRQQEETEEKVKSMQRNQQDRNNEKMQKEYELRTLTEQGEEYSRQIRERQVIMQYLELDDTYLWNDGKIMEAADRKITECDRVRAELEKEHNLLEREWKKLTSGEILELPKDFQELLTRLELHPVYGMNWLEKNGYSVEENTELVRRQPFIPYALILPRQEMKQLELHGQDICTSFPIPIIPREELERTLAQEPTSMVQLSGISFYLWFNEKLLDEDALRVLIKNKESEMTKKQKQLENKKTEYKDALDRKQMLERQSITKEKVEKNRQQITDTEQEISEIDNQIIHDKEEMDRLEQKRSELVQIILKEKQCMEWNQRRASDFDYFCREYDSYLEKHDTLEKNRKEKTKYEDNKKQAQDLLEKYREQQRTLESRQRELKAQTENIQKKYILYQEYRTIPLEIQSRPVSEMEARYEAITTKMSFQLQDLEHQLQKTNGSLNRAKEELARLQHKFLLKEDDWKELYYDEKEEMHQESVLAERKKQYKFKEAQWNEQDKQIGIISSKIDDKNKLMQEQCGKEEILPKEEIRTIDFDGRRNQLLYQIKETERALKLTEKKLTSVQENIASFTEYDDFIQKEEIQWEEDIAQMDSKCLREYAGMIRRDYRHSCEEGKNRRDKAEKILKILLCKEKYQDDFYRKPLDAMMSVSQSAHLLLAQLTTTLQSYESQLAKLEVDISIIGEEKKRIVGLLEDYVKDVHSNMGKIDNNSTITIRERPIKMLRLQMPEWEENEGLYHQRLDDLISELTQKGVEIYEKNENSAEYIGTRITTKNIYDATVGISNIQIKLYKIEEQREYPITWAEVAKNSGGEGFLSAFVILSSLLHYMRRDDTDIFADKKEGKVLVMDNPFAQTNAAHLLKPLMDMAKKTDTQLICLSGLGGDSIYSRFDNIYVLNLVTAGLRGGMQYLRGEHTRGIEEEVMVTSQIEVIGQQSLLF